MNPFSSRRLADAQRKYGLSEEQYRDLLNWSDGRCYICDELPEEINHAIDHDHLTGFVRGLLCRRCNTFLGLVGDSPEAIEALVDATIERPILQALRTWRTMSSPKRAAEYLRQPPAHTIIGLVEAIQTTHTDLRGNKTLIGAPEKRPLLQEIVLEAIPHAWETVENVSTWLDLTPKQVARATKRLEDQGLVLRDTSVRHRVQVRRV